MADMLLKMPPQPAQREERGQFISKDEKLEEFDECRYVFTDIAVANNHEVCVILECFIIDYIRGFMQAKLFLQTRNIVVRETDGTLRHARWSERDRMNQIYFPVKDRQMVLPSLLKDENMPVRFSLQRFPNNQCTYFTDSL